MPTEARVLSPRSTTAVFLPFNAAMLAVCIGAVWLLWGSTFAGMRYATQSFPPFVLGSLRFSVAGLVLCAIAIALRPAWPTARDLRTALIVGATLLLLGNGMTAWVVQYLPTGLTALLIALSPIWMAIFDFAFTRRTPTVRAVCGMALGITGMVLLFLPKSDAGSAISLVPALGAIGASIAWSFGSMYQRFRGADNLVLTTGLQMIVGGVLLAFEALFFGQWRGFDVHAVSQSSLAALGWLIVCGSLIAYSAYLYTMQHASTAVASTYAYVNPIIAIALGAVMFHERLSPIEALAGVVILGGVALMMLPSRRIIHAEP